MKAKRFFSVLLAVMLCLSVFAVSASADNNPIKDTSADVSLTVYLLQGNGSAANASDASTFVITGADGAAPAGYTPIQGSQFTITKVGDATVTATGTTGTDGKVTFTKYGAGDGTKLPQGTYKVENTGTLPAIQSAKVADFNVDLPMTNPAGEGWIYDVTVYPKVPINTGDPTVTKKVKSSTDSSFGTKANIDKLNGEKAVWQIEAALPMDITNYTKFVINDDIDSAKLGTPESISVKFFKSGATTGTDETSKYTLASTATNVTVTLKDFDKMNAFAGGKVVVEFTTELKAIAERVPNDVELTYKNGASSETTIDNNGGTPDDDPTPDGNDGGTPDDHSDDEGPDPYVWTGKIDVLKVDSTNNAVLPNIEFKLYNNADDKEITAANPIKTDGEGKFTISGLADGSYYLVETKTDDNHELLGSRIIFTIDETNLKGNLTSTGTLLSQDATSKLITVKNTPSQKLPLTGGMGVTLFAVCGLALAAAGAFLLKSKRYE